MEIEMRVYGIAIFEVNKDLDVVTLNLENSGLHKLEYMEIDPDLTAYLDMAEEEFTNKLGKYRTIKDYVFEYENERPVLIRFFIYGNALIRYPRKSQGRHIKGHSKETRGQ